MAKKKQQASPEELEKEARVEYCLRLRKSGASYRAIEANLKNAVEHGIPQGRTPDGAERPRFYPPKSWAVSHEQVRNDVLGYLRALKRRNKATAADIRALNELRLEDMLMGVYAKSIGGDVGAGWLMLGILERLAKQEGTDVTPKQKIDQTLTVEYVNDWRKER